MKPALGNFETRTWRGTLQRKGTLDHSVQFSYGGRRRRGHKSNEGFIKGTYGVLQEGNSLTADSHSRLDMDGMFGQPGICAGP